MVNYTNSSSSVSIYSNGSILAGSGSNGTGWASTPIDDSCCDIKYSIEDMCKSKIDLSSEIIRNLLAMNVSLIKTLVDKKIIKEKDLEKNFKMVKRYTDFVKTQVDEKNAEDVLRKTVAKGIESRFPKFLQKEL